MPRGIEGGPSRGEAETGATGEFANEVLSMIRAKERGSAFTDIARADIASRMWGDLENNFSQRLEAVFSSDGDQAEAAWSETPGAIGERSLPDHERVAAWLTMCAADVKAARTLAGMESAGSSPMDATKYVHATRPQFTEREVRGGDVSVAMRNLGDAKPLAANMILEALEVNQDRDGVNKGDPEFEALFENLQNQGGHAKRTVHQLYKTSVPGFILEVDDRDRHGEPYRNDLQWISGHYIFPERLEPMKERMEKS